MTEPRPGIGTGPVVVAGLGTFKGPLQRAPLSSFLRAGLSFPMLESECSRPWRWQAGAWPAARGCGQSRGWVCAAFQPRHVPHAPLPACACPEGSVVVVSPGPWLQVAAPNCCQSLLPVVVVVVVVEEFLERAGKILCPCPGWLVQSSVCFIPTEQRPECHPASHEGTGHRGAGDHPADSGQEAPGLAEEGAAGGVTAPIPLPTSPEPQPRGAVLPTSLAAAKASGMGWDAAALEISCLCSRL